LLLSLGGDLVLEASFEFWGDVEMLHLGEIPFKIWLVFSVVFILDIILF
jgi:hypothetical protein